MLTIFYSPLAQVYKAASISDSIGDLQNFVNDLLRTADQVEECEFPEPTPLHFTNTTSFVLQRAKEMHQELSKHFWIW
jgi:hypothetical protein